MLLRKIDHKKALTALDWNLDKIKSRYMEEHSVDADYAGRMEKELKRFLIICAEYSDGKIGMAGPIDDLWHTFIIFTYDYEEFCNQLNGKLIHHVPFTDADKAMPSKNELTAYERFLTLYEEVFEEKPNENIWPQSAVLASCQQCQSCQNCMGCQGGAPGTPVP